MKPRSFLAVTLLFVLFVPFVFSGEKTETIEIKKTLKFSGAVDETNVLVVDNLDGFIRVTGYDGSTVELIATETITAESDRKIQSAKEGVKLDIEEDGNRIVLYVDSPWRKSDGNSDFRGFNYYGYDVQFDFELKVPRKVELRLSTVNDGEITVKNVEGDFNVSNVNGEITLLGMAGSGKAHTVNGDIKVTFNKNPSKNSSFKTINGEVDIKFNDNLAADLEFKTLNGEVYSDFDVVSKPSKPTQEKSRRGKRVYSRDDGFSVRVGNGGPELTFDTLNGDIYVSKNE